MSERATDQGVTALITDQPLDPVAAEQIAWSPACGAVVVFSGIVRNHDAGQHVDSLSYSAHPSAEAVLHRVATDVAAAHPGVRIWVGHRGGALRVGAHALVAACASAHRAESFAACEALIEQIKAEVPIWKEQFYADGTRHWVGVNDPS